MVQSKLEVTIREPSARVRILGLRGRITRSAEEPLMAAHQQVAGAKTVILNFREVEAMDSTGLGLLIALQARTRRHKQRLAAYGLSAPLRKAFAVTYLDKALRVYAGEAEALAAFGKEAR